MNTSEITLEHLEIDLEKNVKRVCIKNEKDRICFIVSFITLEEKEMWENNEFLVKVQEVKENNELFELSRQFFKTNEKEKAENTFRNMIRDYQVLVKMPEEAIDPRLIFNDNVNYRKIDPDCCGNCCFCVFHEIFDGNCDEKRVIFLCSNKKNLRNNEYMEELLGKYARDSQITTIQDMIEVRPDCVCDNYGEMSERRREA